MKRLEEIGLAGTGRGTARAASGGEASRRRPEVP
jgi:hypothetical protein